jgi:uroporphyrinogen decarboxylase
MIPYALNQKVKFVENQGPLLEEFNFKRFLNNDKISFTQKIYPVYKAIQKTREKLDKKKSLIGFVGAPWTLLIYMLGAKESKDNINYKKIKDKEFEVNLILDKLHEYICLHIENQKEAGVDVVQIFDSWAGLIPSKDLPNYCYIPNLKIVDYCKKNNIPVICFPKGIKENYKEFNSVVKPDGINLDYDIKPDWIKKNLPNVVLQGGLDPKLLLASNEELLNSAKKYLDIFKGLPYIFNLGHGLLPETDPDKVAQLIKFYREY